MKQHKRCIERNTQICKLYKAGKNCRQLSKQFNLTFQRIHQILINNNIQLRIKGRPPFLTKSQTIKLHQKYLKNRRIIYNHRISHGTIVKYFHKYHLSCPKGRIKQFTPEEILKLHIIYITQTKSIQDVARIANTTQTTLLNYFRKFNLKIKPKYYRKNYGTKN